MKDPICGMEVDNEQFTYEVEGKKYYFCSKGCLDRFKKSSYEQIRKNEYDLIIIGGGPAGLSAAVYAAKLKINTFLITKEIGEKAFNSSTIKKYIDFEITNGKDLIKKFQTMFLHEHYLEHKIDEVISIDHKDAMFEIFTKSGNKFVTHSIIIASGKHDKKLNPISKGKNEDSIIRPEFSINKNFYHNILTLNDKREIITNQDCSTSVNGIFASGEVTNNFDKDLINSSKEGVKAAYSAKRFLAKRKMGMNT
jgi:thioredoxin reductase